MKVEFQHPNIVRIVYRQEKSDKDYGSCLWAYFDFDLDKWMLNIQSDVGNYAYRWATEDGSFLKLMASISKDYLIHKLCKQEEVDLDATKESVCYWLKESEASDKDYAIECLFDDLYKGIEKSEAQRIIVDWNDHFDLEIDEPWELIETDFSAWQKKIVCIFTDFVQPKIREELL